MSNPLLGHDAASAGGPAALLAWSQSLPEALRGVVERVERIWLPASTPPWTATPIALRGGQSFSVFASGRVYWSATDSAQWAGPRHHLWWRVGDGPVANPTQDHFTARADRDGPLALSLLHGFWKDESGVLATSEHAYRHLRGGVEAIVVVWSGDPAAGLAAAETASGGDPAIRAERARVADPVPVPEGWRYLLETGTADVYRATDTPHGPGIDVHAANDQGILRKPIDLPLEPDTRLRWRWRLDEFPSALAEDTVTTHDYLSVAVEFDNGRDLTWFWSRCLPPGTHFGCPVRSWTHREIHYCVRSGQTGVGTWQREERVIAPDCEEALGEVPTRLVAVWLIVVSSFQHGVARGAFSEIEVGTPRAMERVL